MGVAALEQLIERRRDARDCKNLVGDLVAHCTLYHPGIESLTRILHDRPASGGLDCLKPGSSVVEVARQQNPHHPVTVRQCR